MRYKIGILIFSFLVLLIMPAQARYFARWHTTMGDFTAELRDDLAPITANNFIDLANAHFYDGLQFHRVIPNFVIQDGDPTGNGYGGPGYTIADEFNVGLYHDSPGVLAMANTGQPHSGGSQYYITLASLPNLDGHYSIFGKVLLGMDVVESISVVPTNASDHPITPVYINTLEILGLVINSVSPADSIVTFDVQNPYPFIMEAYGLISNANFQWFVDDVPQAETEFLFTPNFQSVGNHTVKCITSDETMSWAFTWHVNVTGTANDDQIAPEQSLVLSRNYPNPFHHTTSLTFQSKSNEPLQIRVYDIRGRLIHQEGLVAPGRGAKQWTWDANDAAPGIYLMEVSNGKEHKVVKGILIR